VPSKYTQHLYSSTQGANQAGRPRSLEPNNRIPKLFLYRELVHGRSLVGGQNKCFKDMSKAALKDFSINVNSLDALAEERGAISSPQGLTQPINKKHWLQSKKREQRRDRASSKQLLQ